jgi:calcium and integrin-binding protein 1
VPSNLFYPKRNFRRTTYISVKIKLTKSYCRFEEASFLTRTEIIRVYKRFEEITAKRSEKPVLQRKITRDEFSAINELIHNPFRHRVAKIFSNSKGLVGFEEFLDFLSVFSEEATRDVKTFYAFKIYDWDDDGYLNVADVTKTIQVLVGKELSKQEIKIAVRKIFDEADLDGDLQLSFVEFDHVVSRASDFENTFRIQI